MPAYVPFDVPIDLRLHEMLNALVQSGTLSTAGLTSAHDGLLRRSGNRFYMFDGGALAWKNVATDSDHLGGQTLAQVRARSSHTGTQDAATTLTGLDAIITGKRLDQFVAPNGPVSWNSQKITSLLDGSSSGDAVNKGQLDAAIAAVMSGMAIRGPVVVATTANITLSTLQSIDGYTTLADDLVLVKNQSDNTQNGFYLAKTGAWVRASDADAGGELFGGVITTVDRGTNNADTMWMLLTNGDITPGTTAQVWGQFGGGTTYAGGDGLTLTGNTFAVGAGAGIVVTADAVAVDADNVPFKATGTVPAGSAVVEIVHPLDTTSIAAHVFDSSGEVQVGKKAVSSTNFELTFGDAPTTDEYTYLLIG